MLLQMLSLVLSILFLLYSSMLLFYQKEEGEPLAIGGFLPLEKVYSYEPIPEELNEEEDFGQPGDETEETDTTTGEQPETDG